MTTEELIDSITVCILRAQGIPKHVINFNEGWIKWTDQRGLAEAITLRLIESKAVRVSDKGVVKSLGEAQERRRLEAAQKNQEALERYEKRMALSGFVR